MVHMNARLDEKKSDVYNVEGPLNAEIAFEGSLLVRAKPCFPL